MITRGLGRGLTLLTRGLVKISVPKVERYYGGGRGHFPYTRLKQLRNIKRYG